MNAVAAHSVLNLVDDCLSRCLNPKDLLGFQDVIRGSVSKINTRRSHNLSEAVALNQKLVLVFVFLWFADDGAHNLRNSLNDDMRQFGLELLHDKVHLLSRLVIRLYIEYLIALEADMTLFDLQLRGFYNWVSYGFDGDLKF